MNAALRAIAVMFLSISAGGCLTAESLRKSVTEAATLQQVCVGIASTPEQQRASDYRDVAELVADYLLLPLRPVPGTWREKLRRVRIEIDNAYRTGSADVRRTLRPVADDLERVESRLRSIRATVDAVSEGGRSIYRRASAASMGGRAVARTPGAAGPSTYALASIVGDAPFPTGGPFERLLLLVFLAAETVEMDVRALGLDLIKLHDDLQVARATLPAEVTERLVPVLNELKRSADDLLAFWDTLVGAAAGNGRLELPDKLRNDVEAFVNQTIEREAGRLAIELFHRAARSIEGRLDDLPADQWIAMAALTFLVSEAVSAVIREAVKRAFEAGSKEWEDFSYWALVGLTQGACSRLMAANDSSAPDAFRADELLRPAYRGIVHAYACVCTGRILPPRDVSGGDSRNDL